MGSPISITADPDIPAPPLTIPLPSLLPCRKCFRTPLLSTTVPRQFPDRPAPVALISSPAYFPHLHSMPRPQPRATHDLPYH